MIDKKEISKASAAHAKATWNHDEEQFACMDGFEAGANLAIQEFKKSLWHDASEEPEKNKLIIEEYLDEFGYNYEIDCTTYSCRTWVEMVKVYGIRKWCYIDDILPKKGGEK